VFPLVASSTTLIVAYNCYSLHETQGGGRGLSEMHVRSEAVPLEVTVYTEHDQLPAPRSAYVSTEQGPYEAHELCFSRDVESASDKENHRTL
jgi:hypothetical protein